MNNYIAFKFTDNDFHDPLRKTVEFLLEVCDVNNLASKTDYELKSIVIKGMYAFHLLHNIERDIDDKDHMRLLNYFEKLKVTKVNRLDDIQNFEGYVIDLNNSDSFYLGY